MHHLKRLGLFAIALLHSGHIGGSWVWSGMVVRREREERRHV